MNEAKKIRRVIDLEEAAYPLIRQTIISTLSEWIEKIKKNPKMLKDVSYIPEASQDLSNRTYEVLIGSFMLGAGDSTRNQSSDFADATPEALQFDEAVAFAKGRVSLKAEDYYSLSDSIRARAWTVARLSQLDSIERARSYYLKQLTESGASIESFVESIKLDDSLSAAGWVKGQPGYYETVYRTNIQSDYNAGRAQQFKDDPPTYLEFIGIEDSRQTSICAERTGTILPPNDPWWESNWPPLHYNCRSTVRAIYETEAKKINPSTLQVPKTTGTQKGFGSNPIKDNALWNVTPSQQARISKSMIQDELNEVVGKTVCKDFKTPKAGYLNKDVSRGGLRYKKEVTKGIDLAKNLAQDKGYYVELNSDSTAWVNGMEKWGLTKFTGKASEIANALNKTRSIYIESSVALKGDLSKAIVTALVKMGNRRDISLISLNIGGTYHSITMDHVRELLKFQTESEQLAFIESLL